ncbi:MAG: MFS transporter [Acidobacteria bacterium]|jgi:MFS family permease|nr:MFS transporter [Acidobacteriota bacterium]MBF83527.1 MFS transporter [Acidobacteriota bacterium]|tara:strand:+ start:2915 stop:4069 length:1155 start_codon:yes stop_codon:yes gene_type:complete
MGWLLDSFDVMLYALVLATLMVDLNMSTTTGGSLASVTLAASAVGGIFFGVFADRFGRVRALIWSILIYSVFTAACGFAQSVRQLAVFRVCLGFGMGGEWASGAALISETWPAEHRGKALGLMQSSWAIGYAAAAAVTALVLPSLGWRAVFFIGILPAFFTVWVRRRLEEPEIWQVSVRDPRGRFSAIFGPDLRGLTVALTLMNACIMFAWWGFNLWIPAYLSLPVEDGGIGLSTYAMSGLIIAMQIGMWLGYVLFGFVSDRVGRKRTYVVYVLTAAALTLAYTSTRNPMALLVLGPFVAFFGTGSFSGFGAVTAEIYPTEVRATAQGFTYNIGRLASAVAPWVIGSLAETRGFTAALSITAGAFVLAAVFWLWIPETRGRELT